MLTPSQTIGPFFSHALPWPQGPYVVDAEHPDGFWLRGRVLDGAGEPVPDALVESWQADPMGEFGDAREPDQNRSGDAREPDQNRGGNGFRGFGRCPTDEQGRYGIRTLKPGRVPGPGGAPQAPHLALSIFARGLLHRVVTRVYFPDEAPANAADPVLALVPEAARDTLVARQTEDGYGFDIRLQGEHETVFFAV